MKIAAFDLSLTSAGWAWYNRGTPRGYLPTRDSGVLKTGELRGLKRLDVIRAAVIGISHGAGLAMIEGYSYGSKGRSVLDLAELGGIIRMTLYDLEIPWLEIPPSVLKKYALGKGQGKKEEVLASAIRRLGYPGSSNDEADALWLLEMGMDAYGLQESRVPKSHREALGSIEWPTLAGRGA